MTIIVNGTRRVFDVHEVALKKRTLRKELSKLEAERKAIFANFNEEGRAMQETILADEKKIFSEKEKIKAQLRELSVVKF